MEGWRNENLKNKSSVKEKKRPCKGQEQRLARGTSRRNVTTTRTSSPENVTSPFCCQMRNYHLGIALIAVISGFNT